MKKKKRLNLNIEEIIDLYVNKKWTILDISKKFKVSFATLKSRLMENKIKLRSHSKNQKMVMNREEVKTTVSEGSKKANKKRIKTNIEKYGHAVPSNNSNIREEWQQKHLEEHDVIWPNQRDDVKESIRNTCQEKYETDNVSKTNHVREKIKNNRWKNKTEEELDVIWFKTIQTWLKNYNETHPVKTKEIQQKIINTNLKNRNVKYVTQDPTVKEKIQITRIKNAWKKVENKLKIINLEVVEDFNTVSTTIKLKCLKCNNIFTSVLDYVFHGYGLCPKCFPRNVSNPENEIREFVVDLIGNKTSIKSNTRTFLSSKKEIDILIDDLKIAIEHDGLYYHSNDMVSKNYHLDKTLECENIGYRMIHIFEDEWMFKQNIVKERIKHILNSSKYETIYARKCIIKEITNKEKNDFLNTFHIQGIDISKIRLGAFYNNELVSVMTFSKGNISKGSKYEEGVWELNRFCSNYNYHIPGIASKLLTYFKRNYEWKKIFSYADRRWSNGNLYYKLGFKLDKITEPNYWYTKGYKRIHRFNLRKTKDDPKDIPEWILRQSQGYRRIWDCGNLKFIMINNQETN